MAEEERRPPRSAEELLRRHAAGEREFRGADLSGADLRGTNLSGADLRGANLIDANLRGANLSGADLRGANLSGANLSRADLSGADLRGANLHGADLRGANLSEANLRRANLIDANLIGADLRRANLSGADLSRADLSRADLSRARVGGTHFVNLDLSPLCDADPPVEHLSPSNIDHRAILKSLRSPHLKDFLQRAGMPEVFIEYNVSCAQSLATDVFKLLQSTFISYGAPDEPFARKLYVALHRNGVTTFYFPAHAKSGDKLHRTMRDGITGHDRVILICSKTSLDRPGLLYELEETLAREARPEAKGASYLLPLRLDDHVFTAWKPERDDLARAVRDRVVANFEGADTDEAKFNAGLLKLIAALKKP